MHLGPQHAEVLEQLELACFPTAFPADLYDAAEYVVLAEDFAEGCFVGLDGEEVVAAGLGVRTQFDFESPQHNMHDLLEANGTESGHDAEGPWYYGTDIIVRQDYRRRGIGKELYDLRKDVCRNLNLAGIVAGGVIPGFADHKHNMSADDYVAKVGQGELYDPTLTFQLENGFTAPCALANYITDPAVDDYASLIVWHNPEYRPERPAPPTGQEKQQN